MNLIDTLAWVAVTMMSAGVYMEFGVGWALICCGLCIMAMAAYSAEQVNNAPSDTAE